MSDSQIRQSLIDHMDKVKSLLMIAREELYVQAEEHDRDKFDPEQFDRHKQLIPKLALYEYGSEEYKQNLKELAPALKLPRPTA